MDIYEVVKMGNYADFIKCYNGKINMVDKYTQLNLLQTALTRNEKLDEKMKIIEFLLKKKIDINYIGGKHKRNALHIFFFNIKRTSIEYYMNITTLLIKNGIDINKEDEYGAISLNYLLSLNKLSDEELKPLYILLLQAGADYLKKDKFDKSCLDYAKEYSWRKGFLELVGGYQDDTK